MELENHDDSSKTSPSIPSDDIVISNVTNSEEMDVSKTEPTIQVATSVSPTLVEDETFNRDTKTSYDNIIANVGSMHDLKPSEALNLAWEDINVFVDRGNGACCGRRETTKTDVLHILKNVTGEIKSGSLVALMGSSGAGKSTLLNVLSHRNISSVNVSGAVFVNGKPVSSDISNMSAYVQQEDLFIGTLTVREHLIFQALLRIEKHIPKEERLKRVEKTILELGLTKCSNTIIGIPGRLRGISGGEKKRLSFASEILTDPPLLFVDEPTSGLDSFMAQTVVGTLQKLTKRGKTVLATIHQPSSEVYQMFDNVILLSDGRVAYIGPRQDAISNFGRIGYNCPTNFNPADYFIHILSVIPEKEEESKERIKFICDKHQEWENSQTREKKPFVRIDSFGHEIISGPRYQTGWWTQLRVLLYRSILSAKRDKMVSVIRIMQSLIIGVVVGLIYLRLDYNQKNIQNFAGLLFFIVTNLSFSSLQGVIFVFPVEVPVFLREHKNGMYRTDTYFLAKTLAEIPVFCLAAFLLILISYWMTGLRDTAEAFFTAVGICILVINTAASYGYVISTISSSIETATAIGPLIMLPLLLFGGFFLNNDTVPDYFIWLRYLSWFNYGFENLMINQWEGYTGIACNQVNGTDPCRRTGEMVLRQFQLHELVCLSAEDPKKDRMDFYESENDNFNRNIYVMLGLLCGFRILAFLLLYRRARKSQ